MATAAGIDSLAWTHGRSRRTVAEQSTEMLLEEYRETRDLTLRDELARRHDHIVRWLAHKLVRDNVAIDDLIQMGRVGLLHAIDRFDAERGASFATYAIRMIAGEMKHYFRDCAWSIRVPRPLRDLFIALPKCAEALSAELGRQPTMTEIATHLGVSEEDIVAAIESGNAYSPQSLNYVYRAEEWESDEELQDRMGQPDARLEAIVEHDALRRAMGSLDDRKYRILHHRYFEQCSQKEVARKLGISQMHVSRLERNALAELRAAMSTA